MRETFTTRARREFVAGGHGVHFKNQNLHVNRRSSNAFYVRVRFLSKPTSEGHSVSSSLKSITHLEST